MKASRWALGPALFILLVVLFFKWTQHPPFDLTKLHFFQPLLRLKSPEFDSIGLRLENIELRLSELPCPPEISPGGTFGHLSKSLQQSASPFEILLEWPHEQVVDTVSLLPLQEPTEHDHAKAFAFRAPIYIEFMLKGSLIHREIIKKKSAKESAIRATLPHTFAFPAIKIDKMRIFRSTKKLNPKAQFGLAECFVFSGNKNIAAFASLRANSELKRTLEFRLDYLTDEQTPLGLPQTTFGGNTVGYQSLQSHQHGKTVNFDFSWQKEQVLDEVRLFPIDRALSFSNSTSGFPRSLRVLCWDNKSWNEVYSDGNSLRSSPGMNPVPVRFKQVKTQRLRIQITKLWRGKTASKSKLALSEVQFRHEGEVIGAANSLTISDLVSKKRTATKIDGRQLYWDPKGLSDGMSSNGRILHEKQWLKDLDERADLLLEKFEKQAAFEPLFAKANLFCWRVATGLPSLIFYVLLILFVKAKIKQLDIERKVRDQLAADLHDDLGSNLSSLSLYTQRLKRKTTGHDKIIDAQLRLISDSLTSLKEMVALMSPQITSTRALVDVFASMIEIHCGGLDHDFFYESSLKAIDYKPSMRRHLYCFLKEAVSNAAKHSQGDRIRVRLYHDVRKHVVLEVKDNGKGVFDENSQSASALSTLKIRAKEMMAKLEVSSKQGYCIKLILHH